MNPAALFLEAIDSLSTRSVILFGGKGGVGKTTCSILAALHFARSRPTILLTTDPASALLPIFDELTSPKLTVERIDASALYAHFLGENLQNLLELGDRGTYLDRSELEEFFQLSLPGIDELMGWMRIGELAEAHHDSLLIVDTAPTGHTLRMISSSDHFRQFAEALAAMQSKHRTLVEQLTRRQLIDPLDSFIEKFRSSAAERLARLQNRERSAFVPVTLSEPWVMVQTRRLIGELRGAGLDVPFVVLNRAAATDDCDRCRTTARLDREASLQLAPDRVVPLSRSCAPIASRETLERFLSSDVTSPEAAKTTIIDEAPLAIPASPRLLFVAGKGGVGKTTTAVSIALQLAARASDREFALLSIDPAHTLSDVFREASPPSNLRIETIDTREKWRRLMEKLGGEIDAAMSALTPRGFSAVHDREVLGHLLELAPPGADELFAVMRISDILESSVSTLIVDTAPTGHFLRFLDLPQSAGEWVREFLRVLLKYRDLIPPGSLAQELVRASKALHRLEEILRSEACGVVVVLRPQSLIVTETTGLLAELQKREVRVTGLVANYLTPQSDCPCDELERGGEIASLAPVAKSPLTLVQRQLDPPTDLDRLRNLVPLAQTASQ